MHCDHGHETAEEIRALPYSTDGNTLVCQRHYKYEMSDRLLRLFDGVISLQFPRWEDLKVYEEV